MNANPKVVGGGDCLIYITIIKILKNMMHSICGFDGIQRDDYFKGELIMNSEIEVRA